MTSITWLCCEIMANLHPQTLAFEVKQKSVMWVLWCFKGWRFCHATWLLSSCFMCEELQFQSSNSPNCPTTWETSKHCPQQVSEKLSEDDGVGMLWHLLSLCKVIHKHQMVLTLCHCTPSITCKWLVLHNTVCHVTPFVLPSSERWLEQCGFKDARHHPFF